MELLDVILPAGTGANKQLPDPYLVNYYEQLENRTIWLDKELTEDGVEIVKKILRWNTEDADRGLSAEERTPIKLMLLSPGGDIYQMLAIMDAVKLSKTPVYTCACGFAASAACVILLSGHKRFAFQHSHAMWHSGSAGLSGSMEQVQSATKHLDGVEAQMQEFFLERTKVSPRLLKKYKDKDWYFNASEMLEHGLIDAVVNGIEEIL